MQIGIAENEVSRQIEIYIMFFLKCPGRMFGG